MEMQRDGLVGASAAREVAALPILDELRLQQRLEEHRLHGRTDLGILKRMGKTWRKHEKT